MTSHKDIVGQVKLLHDRGLLQEFTPYCIGLVGKEEADVLDCREGDEYALFHEKHRPALCDWFGGKFNVEQLAQAVISLEENLKSMEQTNADLLKKLKTAVEALDWYAEEDKDSRERRLARAGVIGYEDKPGVAESALSKIRSR